MVKVEPIRWELFWGVLMSGGSDLMWTDGGQFREDRVH